MRIAVTYENGEVFQHFKNRKFKIYEVENNKIVNSQVMGSNGIDTVPCRTSSTDRCTDLRRHRRRWLR